MIRRSIVLLPLLVGLAACASRPIIDTQGVDMARYESDLAHCQRIAQQVRSGQKVATRSAVGAGTGAATGAILDDVSAGEGAGVGAISGAVAGGFSADSEKDRVVKNCLRQRGYTVYN